ncbi:MAG TPA: hypothetical protein VD813_10615, partial [Pseudonocardia sp.]|nr:hypothetical protein [Pseudonocardia sp.]
VPVRDVPVRDAPAREVPARDVPAREAPLREAAAWSAPAVEPRAPRSFPPEPVPGPGPRPTPAQRPEPVGRASSPVAPRPNGARPGLDPVRDRPTDLIPRLRDEEPRRDLLTGPISLAEAAALSGRARPGTRDGGPETEAWDGLDLDDELDSRIDADLDADLDSRIDAAAPERDDGPPTMVGDAPVGAEAWHRERVEASRPGAGRPLVDPDEAPAGLGGRADAAEGAYEEVDDESGPDGAESSSQAWAAVLAQWIIGAVGGAALWVGFRFLWRGLPVVALAAAVLVTIGLVVVVRALLRNNDARTTVFAVLVGLLLTASPAILVLLGR